MRRKEGGEEKREGEGRGGRGRRRGSGGRRVSVFKAGNMVAMYSFNSLFCH